MLIKYYKNTFLKNLILKNIIQKILYFFNNWNLNILEFMDFILDL